MRTGWIHGIWCHGKVTLTYLWKVMVTMEVPRSRRRQIPHLFSRRTERELRTGSSLGSRWSSWSWELVWNTHSVLWISVRELNGRCGQCLWETGIDVVLRWVWSFCLSESLHAVCRLLWAGTICSFSPWLQLDFALGLDPTTVQMLNFPNQNHLDGLLTPRAGRTEFKRVEWPTGEAFLRVSWIAPCKSWTMFSGTWWFLELSCAGPRAGLNIPCGPLLTQEIPWFADPVNSEVIAVCTDRSPAGTWMRTSGQKCLDLDPNPSSLIFPHSLLKDCKPQPRDPGGRQAGRAGGRFLPQGCSSSPFLMYPKVFLSWT